MPSDAAEALVNSSERACHSILFDLYSVDEYGKSSLAYVRCPT